MNSRLRRNLTKLEAIVLHSAPREWTILDRQITRPYYVQIGNLIDRGFIERKPLGDSIVWRRKPKTVAEAAADLVMALPWTDDEMSRLPYREQLAELRRQLEVLAEQQAKETVDA